MQSYAGSILINGPYHERQVAEAAALLRNGFDCNPTFALAFISPDYVKHWQDFSEVLRLHGHIPMLAGCTGVGLIGRDQESEQEPGFSLMMLSIPGGKAHAFEFSPSMFEAADGPEYWRHHVSFPTKDIRAWLAFLDPFSLPAETWLQQWNEAFPKTPTFGGLASAQYAPPQSWVFCNDHQVDGGLVIGLSGDIEVHGVVSQGCRPIGEPLTITKADQNVLYSLGSKPALEVLNSVFDSLSDREKERARGQIFAGLAMNEYVDDFKRGDFLVRSILGADPKTGAVALGAYPRIGQTLQYQLRDADAANEDLIVLLRDKQKELKKKSPFAALLCSCNGRGQGLFGSQGHDASTLNQYFPDLPVAGFFANGEIGPVGSKNYAHGYTASIALFCHKEPRLETL